jgi:hypothetical protein
MNLVKKHTQITRKKISLLCLAFTSFVFFGIFYAVLFVGNLYGKECTKIDNGLFLCEFDLPATSMPQNPKIIVIKISPKVYTFKLLCASEQNNDGLTAKEWCRDFGLIAAINAGMFLPDHKTNVGYMKNFGHVNNGRINSKYHSVAAFNPEDSSLPPFKIFDSDERDIRTIVKNYNTVIQNLRLIKSPRENRWTRQNKKWSEAALGQDKDGNALFIFSPSPLSMYEFNTLLLKLPIDIISAQHLEGGPEASLYFSHGGKEIDFKGNAFGVPNVIGFSKSKK